MHLARDMGARYLHLPFLGVAHQASDPKGAGMEPDQWANDWECFLNLGEGELALSDLVSSRGKWDVMTHMDRRPDRAVFDGKGKKAFFDVNQNRIVPVSFEFVRNPGEWQYTLSPDLVDAVRDRFARGPVRNHRTLYEGHFTEVAIHIRRGDVWDVVRGGSDRDEGHLVRYVLEDYYIDLIARIHANMSAHRKPIRFHVFSDGKKEDFERFEFVDDTHARIYLEGGAMIDNILFHLQEDAFNTLHLMSRADILIPAKSAFSALAIILGRAMVIYDDFIFDLGVFSPFRQYMKGDSRFVRMEQLVSGTIEF